MTTFNLFHTFYGVNWWWKPDVSVMSVEGLLLRIFVFMAIRTSFPVISSFAFSIVNTKRMAPMEIYIFQDIFLLLSITPALIARLQNLFSGHQWRRRCCCCFSGGLIYLYKMAICAIQQCNAIFLANNIFKDLNTLFSAYLGIAQTLKNHNSKTGWHRHLSHHRRCCNIHIQVLPHSNFHNLKNNEAHLWGYLTYPCSLFNKFYGYLLYGNILPKCCGWASVLV